MRMSSATARIYEKTTATTRAPLSRVRDLDISPKAQKGMTDNIYGADHRKIIAKAMQQVRNRKQFSLGVPNKRAQSAQTRQSIHEYLDQKKQMFRVQLAQNTIGKQIDQLTVKESQRREALFKSS